MPTGTGEGWGSQLLQFAFLVVGTIVVLIKLRHLVVLGFVLVVILGWLGSLVEWLL